MTVLAATNLSVTASDGSPLLSDVSISLDAGEMAVVCGRPGSGKTLLLKALKGLLASKPGLTVEGEVTATADIGYVFQTPRTQLVRRTVRRDLAFGLENRGIAPSEIEDRIASRATHLEAEDLLDREVAGLSDGETAMVALLGVLVTDPDVIVLDEPFASMDYPNTRLLLDALDRLTAGGTAILVAEHDLRDLLDRADHVHLLRDGTVAESGPPGDVTRALVESGVWLPFRIELAYASSPPGREGRFESAPGNVEVDHR